MKSGGIRGALVEVLTYALLLFTPLAFGGVELWAMGVVQITSGLLFVVWFWPSSRKGEGAEWGGRSLLRGVPVLLFVALIAVQLVPLPPGVIRSISPGAHELYSQTIPGYSEGREFNSGEIPAWMMDRVGDRVPASFPDADDSVLEAPLREAPYSVESSAWRTLSVYPFVTRQMLWLLLCLVVVYIVVTGHFTTKKRLRRLVAMAVFSGFAVSFVGILHKLTSDGRGAELLWFRHVNTENVFGPFVNRNTYAAFAVMLLPVALSMALAAFRQQRRGDPDAMPRLFLWGFAAITMITGVFYSLSRMGIISVVLSMVIVAAVMVTHHHRFGELIVMIGLAAASVAFLVWIGPETVVERVGTLSLGTDVSSFESRLGAWERSIDMVADHPLTGSGLGTFRYGFMRYAPPGESWWMVADNSFIELVCDTGILGGLLFLAALALYAAHTARPSRLKSGSDRYLHAGIAAGLLSLMFASTSSSNLQMPAVALLAVVMAAALSGLIDSDGNHRSSKGGA